VYCSADGLLCRLSAELYSRPAHFILELVQNADDNSYGPGIEPMLAITLSNTHMDIRCNELGFSEDNVRAFCGVGQSTKRNKSGYIGEQTITTLHGNSDYV